MYAPSRGDLRLVRTGGSCALQGGTRLCSTQVREGEYNLTIRPDTSNHRYRVWFYFSVRNCYAGQCIVLTITNFSKTKSTYRDGMTVPEYLCGARLSGSLEVPLGALSVVRHRPGRSQRTRDRAGTDACVLSAPMLWCSRW